MVGVWPIVLASSSTPYGKVPSLILKKTSRLTQAVVFFRRHFLCGALFKKNHKLLCNCSSAEREGLSTHHTCPTRLFSIITLYAQHPVTENLHISPRFSPTIFYRGANSVLLLYNSIPLYSSRLYAQNPAFEIVHDESVKVCLHMMYNGNVQQNPLCVELCVTTEFSISPRFSSTTYDPDANSVLYTFVQQ